MIHSIKLLRELARLVTMRLDTPPTTLVVAVDRLHKECGVGGPVEPRLAAVAGPQVIGFRRAILMIPADFMAGLPAAERDAILLHELAHARRHDFAWNLLQRLALALVWFHPAAWALYKSIALEREAICDASAVSQGASPKMLAQGLLRLAERQGRQTIAMTSSGGAALGKRIHRLLSPAIAPASLLRRAAAGSGVLALFGVAMAVAEPGPNATRMRELYIASGFGPTVIVNARDPAGAFALRIRQGRVVQASIEHQSVPAEHIIQKGDMVTLLGSNRRPAVSLRVFANGRIRWDARD
jgi:beta-lactamase regulating signal transducer with metallopeptidase domain